LKIAIAQINTQVGALEKNAKKIRAFSEKASAAGADLVVFPELALTGYPPSDLLRSEFFLDQVEEKVESLKKDLPRDLLVVFGAVLRRKRKSLGKPLANAALALLDGELLGFSSKILLPDYDVFDERRWFEGGSELGQITWKGKRIILSICEDIWFSEISDGFEYHKDPLSDSKLKNSNLLLNLSSSPYRKGVCAVRWKCARIAQNKLAVPVVYVNQVGAQDQLIFDGRSFFCDRDSNIQVMKGFGEGVGLLNYKNDGISLCHNRIGSDLEPSFQDEAELEGALYQEVCDALILGLRDYALKTNFDGYLIGLSGGIDSAVACALAVKAVGPDKVFGVAMPSQNNPAQSRKDAEALARNLGIGFGVFPIKFLYSNTKLSFQEFLKAELKELTQENLQARLRGMILMGLSNQSNRLLIAPGNKSEYAVGYSTLYGDMCGALAPIGDLYKNEVYKLGRVLQGRFKNSSIPENIFQKAPSAELAPDQKDEQTLPPYEALDAILTELIDEEKLPGTLLEEGRFSRDHIIQTSKLLEVSEYKRHQAPPILKVSKKAFGIGRRRVITDSFPSLDA
jgi:NAD+ synthase (glutamine-hydrolysing)